MIFKILFSVAFSLGTVLNCFPQDTDKTIRIGDKHFESGQITEALYAYQRAVFFSPSNLDPDVLLKIADCFVRKGDFDNSIEYFDHAYYAGPGDSIKIEILFRKANSFIQTTNYHFALIELLGIKADDGSLLEQRKALYMASAYYGLEDYSKAESYFLKALPITELDSRAAVMDIFSKKSNFYRPNPTAAFWMSVFFPGTGQFYSGDWAAGINSFILTGSLAALTIYLTKLYHPIDAILTVLPWFQRYYQGGFGQAERIAELQRERKRNETYQVLLTIVSKTIENY